MRPCMFSSDPIFIRRSTTADSAGRTISKWMIYIWFGLDGTGIQRSTEFHWLLGPSLMVTFAFLGNTLFLTILVSMLSNTFSTIASNATAEVQFRHAVFTLEGVKSDAIFAYQPPFNILALLVLVPLRFVASPRWFHKIHVFSVRLLNLPLLLIIAVVERRGLWPGPSNLSTAEATEPGRGGGGGAKRGAGLRFWERWRITAHSDIETVFEIPAPDAVLADDESEDDGDHAPAHNTIRRQLFARQTTTSADAGATKAAANTTRDSAGGEETNRPPSAKGRESSSARGTAPPPPPGKTPSRRDSIAFPGLAQQIRGMLTEHADDNNLADRLEALEEATARIERLLARLVGDESLASNEVEERNGAEEAVMDEREEEEVGRTGTIRDLDRSVHEE